MTEYRITTKDNPWDPFTQFDDWFRFDTIDHTYNSSALLARIAMTSPELSEQEYNDELKEAIGWIIAHDPSDMYRCVSRETSDD